MIPASTITTRRKTKLEKKGKEKKMANGDNPKMPNGDSENGNKQITIADLYKLTLSIKEDLKSDINSQ